MVRALDTRLTPKSYNACMTLLVKNPILKIFYVGSTMHKRPVQLYDPGIVLWLQIIEKDRNETTMCLHETLPPQMASLISEINLQPKNFTLH